jgi:hypothetical protein
MSSTSLILSHVETVELCISPDAIQLRSDALNSAKSITTILSKEDKESGYNALRSIKAVLKQLEESRTMAKAPVIAIGREIDGIAQDFAEMLVQEEKRLKSVIGIYEDKLRVEFEMAERERIAAVRKVEEEREKAQREALRKIRETEEAAAAAKTIDAKAALEVQRQQQIDSANAEQQRLARERCAAQQIGSQERAEGAVVSRGFDFEVEDLAALYAAHPEAVKLSPMNSVIKGLISAGMRTCPGLRIFPSTKISVRKL